MSDTAVAPSEAEAAYTSARALAEAGRLEEALVEIERARDLWLASGEQVLALRTNLGLMQVLDDLGRHAEAIEVGHDLLGRVHELVRTSGDDSGVRVVEAAAWGNIGVAAGFTGDHSGALAAHQRSERLYARLGMAEQVAQQQVNSGAEMMALGRVREAADVLDAARRSFLDSGDAESLARCADHLADARLQLGDVAGSIEVLEAALPVLSSIGALVDQVRLRRQLATVYLGAGLCAEGVLAASQALDGAIAMHLAHDAALARLTLAVGLLGAGSIDAAEREVGLAVDGLRQTGDRHEAAKAELLRFELLTRRGSHAEAGSALARAEQAARSGGWRPTLVAVLLARFDATASPVEAQSVADELAELADELCLPDVEAEVDLRLARLDRRAGRTSAAVARLTRRAERLDAGIAPIPGIHLAHGYRSDRLGAHDELVSVLAERRGTGDAALALAVSDRSKAHLLSEILRAAEDVVPATDGAGAADSGPRRPPTLAYHVAGAEIVAFTASGDRVRVHQLGPIAADVRRLTVALSHQWSRFRMNRELTMRHLARLTTTTRTVLADLYDLLVRPVRAQLDRIVDGGELLVVPDGLVRNVPFHALFDGSGYLVERWATTFGLTSLVACPEFGRPGADGLAVLANPDADAPFIAAEADALAASIPRAAVWSGDAATFERLVSVVPGHRFVHLACHGRHRGDNPLFSAFALADRWVTGAEVLDLGIDLGGALVSISACESGRSSVGAGDGLGLAWAFLAAGAHGVVAGKWIVDDAAAVRLMSDFYRGLDAGSAPSSALRAAQLAALSTDPHPFHWAPFVFVTAPHVTSRRTS